MSSNVEEQDAEPLELLSEAQKAARDADLDARLEKLKLEVNQEPIHLSLIHISEPTRPY